MSSSLFTSEAVSNGHPDKVADQISDAVLDACLRQDPYSKVACETLITSGLVVLAGEITTKANIDYQQIVRSTLKTIGYDSSTLGFDYRTCGIIVSINKQSPDIARGVENEQSTEIGAGDQGMMFGYACNETDVYMPLPITIAHHLMDELRVMRDEKVLPYLGPDAKAQVTVEYDKNHRVKHIHTIVISTQHHEDVDQATIVRDMKGMVKRVIPPHLIDESTRYYINPTGRFVIGGPVADCGLTGRKTMVDTYGGMGRHGGGAFSGKDATKVDRSGAYAARYVAKTIVAAGLAERCEVQLAYAIGIAQPVSVKVDLKGSGIVDDEQIAAVIPKIFDLTPKGIVDHFKLRRPIYEKVAYGGHFGRADVDLPWERLDKVEELRQALSLTDDNDVTPSSFAFTTLREVCK